VSAATGKPYPDCGCPPDPPTFDGGIFNVVCRNADCCDYGTHRRGWIDDRCQWCGHEYVPLYRDPFRGAR